METDILSLLREELRKQLADSMDADWQAAVKDLAARADREIDVVQRFGRCLYWSLEQVRHFPWTSNHWAGKAAPVLSPNVEHYHKESMVPREPIMSDAEHDAILARARIGSPAFGRMMAEGGGVQGTRAL